MEEGKKMLELWMSAQYYTMTNTVNKALVYGTPGEMPAWDVDKFIMYASNDGVAFINNEEIKPLTNKDISEWKKKKNIASKSPEADEDQEPTRN